MSCQSLQPGQSSRDTSILPKEMALEVTTETKSVALKPNQLNSWRSNIILTIAATSPGLTTPFSQISLENMLKTYRNVFVGDRLSLSVIMYFLSKVLGEHHPSQQGINTELSEAFSVFGSKMFHPMKPRKWVNTIPVLAEGKKRLLTIECEIELSFFEGISFPDCAPDWFREFLMTSPEYQIVFSDESGHYHIE
ncbi:TPA_asm: hypothetical protein [Psilorhabdovirus 1]|nr:TPA_asm: hypothetical protein [Psilorhabdovirus 1]